MNKNMGYLLIVVGFISIIFGIFLLTRNDKHVNDSSKKNLIEKSSKLAVDSNITELSSKEKGDAFENFVVNLLADHRFSLLDRTQDAVSSAGVVAESCKNPDLHVQQKYDKSNIDYYIECKYRSKWTNGVVTFEDWQIDRYRKFQQDNHRKVLIALGVGGTADAPAIFRIVPIDSIKGNAIRKIDTKYSVEPTPSSLLEYINSYFNTVFNNNSL